MRATYAKGVMVGGKDISDGTHMIVTPETMGEIEFLTSLIENGGVLSIMEEPIPDHIRATKAFAQKEWEHHHYRVFIARGASKRSAHEQGGARGRS